MEKICCPLYLEVKYMLYPLPPLIFIENTEMWNKCPRENDLLKLYRGYSRMYGTDEYFESGGRGHNIYFTSGKTLT
jgi:hypothetical protein